MRFPHRLAVAVLLGTSLAAGTVALAAPAAEAASPASRVCTGVLAAHDYGYAYVPWHLEKQSYDCLLSKGDGGRDGVFAVMTLQNSMNTCYPDQVKQARVYPLKVDGKFGQNTYAALIKVQLYLRKTDKSIVADGILGMKTKRAMLWADQVEGGTCHSLKGAF
jgi:hypothetical protein